LYGGNDRVNDVHSLERFPRSRRSLIADTHPSEEKARFKQKQEKKKKTSRK